MSVKKKVVVTGANGLLGWHACSRVYAKNCAARFNNSSEPFTLAALGNKEFNDDKTLQNALSDADCVLHFAGMNRGADNVVEEANPAIAERLTAALKTTGSSPHIVYANSVHAKLDNPYGRSKRIAGEILSSFSGKFTDIVLPHIFGERAKPFYNNVTATLIQQLIDDSPLSVNPDGKVQLLHAGEAAQLAIDAGLEEKSGVIKPRATELSVPDLLDKLTHFHKCYQSDIFPDMNRSFDQALFNTYRSATYPHQCPRILEMKNDIRGSLFEAVKGAGGQTFLSTTHPGVTRGNHFHIDKVERFLVVKGDAIIRIRRVMSDKVSEYKVSGKNPSAIDIPTLHTHSIENVGTDELLTLFWSDSIFDPSNPDTFADTVLS